VGETSVEGGGSLTVLIVGGSRMRLL